MTSTLTDTLKNTALTMRNLANEASQEAGRLRQQAQASRAANAPAGHVAEIEREAAAKEDEAADWTRRATVCDAGYFPLGPSDAPNVAYQQRFFTVWEAAQKEGRVLRSADILPDNLNSVR